MGNNRPSNRDAPRVPGSESGGTPWGRIIAGLLLLLLLLALIPFACQALRGGSGDPGSQGAANDGSRAEGGQKGAGNDRGSGADNDDAKADDAKADDAKADNANAGGAGGGAGDAEAAGQDPGAGGEGSDAEVANADVSGAKVEADVAEVPDQSGRGETVVVPDAALRGKEGWIAIHADDGGRPGEVLGHAALREGSNENARVPLDRPVGSSQKLYAMVHVEDPADGRYTFPDGDPPAMRQGEMALASFRYTLTGQASGGGGTGAQAGTGIRGDTLPESGGPPLALPALAAAVLGLVVCGLLVRRVAR